VTNLRYETNLSFIDYFCVSSHSHSLFKSAYEERRSKKKANHVDEVSKGFQLIPVRMNEKVFGMDFVREVEKRRGIILGTNIQFHVIARINDTPRMREIPSSTSLVLVLGLSQCGISRIDRWQYFRESIHRCCC
jgi:hypothetical protein